MLIRSEQVRCSPKTLPESKKSFASCTNRSAVSFNAECTQNMHTHSRPYTTRISTLTYSQKASEDGWSGKSTIWNSPLQQSMLMLVCFAYCTPELLCTYFPAICFESKRYNFLLSFSQLCVFFSFAFSALWKLNSSRPPLTTNVSVDGAHIQSFCVHVYPIFARQHTCRLAVYRKSCHKKFNLYLLCDCVCARCRCFLCLSFQLAGNAIHV